MMQIESPAIGYILDHKEKQQLHDEIISCIDSSASAFNEKVDTHNRNYDYYMGKQWTAEEQAEIERQFRQAYVFNEIRNKVNHLIGTQTQTRLDSRIVARERGDEAAAELLTFLVKWVEQINQIEYTETELFTDGLIGGAGASVVRWQMEDVNRGYPAIEKIPINEVVWDMNSKKMDLSDARWIARVWFDYRIGFAESYPEYNEEIKNAGTTSEVIPVDSLRSSLTDRQKESLKANFKNANFTDYDIVRGIEFYKRIRIYSYVVADLIQEENKPFDRKKDAEEYYNGLVAGYTESGQVLLNPDGSNKVAIITNTKDGIWMGVVIGDKLCYYDLTDLPDLPIFIHFAYFRDGDYQGFVDDLIHPQILLNRSFSQWDYSLGVSSKNPITVITQMLAVGWTLEDVAREWSKTGPVIPVMDHRAVQERPPVQVNPQLFQNIDFAIGRMTDYAGGRNALGFTESAAESGRAVIARAEQGGISRLPLFDHLRLWRLQAVKRIVWWLKNYMSAGQVIRVIGRDDDVRYINIDDGLLDTLKELDFDIVIDEVPDAATTRDANFQQMKELFSVIPGLPPEIISKIMIEYSRLPQSKKREITDMLEFYKKYMEEQAQAQKEQKLTQEVQDSIAKRILKDEMLRGEEIEGAQKEVAKKERNVQTQLSDIEKMRADVAQGRVDAQQQMSAQDRLNTKEEMGGLVSKNVLSIQP